MLKAAAERMAINAPIQGTQADLIKLAMKEIGDEIKKGGKEEGIRLILQVHDELVFEVRKELAAEMAKKFKSIMEGVLVPSVSRGVPIVAEANIGDNWGDMKRYV